MFEWFAICILITPLLLIAYENYHYKKAMRELRKNRFLREKQALIILLKTLGVIDANN
ncbi:MAG: hypothetical protein HWN81_00160 [Candidatus Lokiarchaeota archaeon]|nr:hypothetical protein [Candidatus Lokiarchaeota archaeon]